MLKCSLTYSKYLKLENSIIISIIKCRRTYSSKKCCEWLENNKWKVHGPSNGSEWRWQVRSRTN